jgi:SAM-dependent methyltransferase
MSPLSNAYLDAEDLHKVEPLYPLRAFVCDECFLVQLEEYESPDHIFSDYAYFSSYSASWLDHARDYTAQIVERLSLGADSHVVEIGSNDGYLLQYFTDRNIPVLGVEPAVNVAEVAEARGIPTLTRFFGQAVAGELTSQGKQADLIIGNNVLAHVPGLNDFVSGLSLLLKAGGVITMEFPHLMRLMEGNQFDTIYHEHFSYYSLVTIEKIFYRHGLAIYDVDELPTHGGSLRIYAKHKVDVTKPIEKTVHVLRQREIDSGFTQIEHYLSFQDKVERIKDQILKFFTEAKTEGTGVAGYGAPAKANTLLNYCGIGTDLMDYTVDRNPWKQGRYLPGSHIPIKAPDKIKETKPGYLFILPWNIKDEIMDQMGHIRDWGGKFVVPIPQVTVVQNDI